MLSQKADRLCALKYGNSFEISEYAQVALTSEGIELREIDAALKHGLLLTGHKWLIVMIERCASAGAFIAFDDDGLRRAVFENELLDGYLALVHATKTDGVSGQE